MELGAFLISLAVKDIHASRAFYEKLGFQSLGGDIEQNWLILTPSQPNFYRPAGRPAQGQP